MYLWYWLTPIILLLGLALVWRFYGMGRAIQAERARESFRLQHERLEKQFFDYASKSGSPRGLRWVSCDFSEQFRIARDKHGGGLVALVVATIQFEAIEGGDMEGLPAVPLPRQGSAVFRFARGEWTTVGRVIFNLTPEQILHDLPHEFQAVPCAAS